MESIKEIYKIGKGPSSSHTMGPKKAAEMFKGLCPGASSFVVTLYGSLAATGKGHLTDVALKEALTGGSDTGIEIVWKPKEFLPQHPNGMNFKAYNAQGEMLCEKTYFSVGGGDISETGRRDAHKDVYPFNKMKDILGWCNENNSYFWEYVAKYEDPDIWDYLAERWDYNSSMQRRGLLFAYALAVSEENASGGTIVTAPTCGSCGVLPAVLYLFHTSYGVTENKIVNAMATAGLVGALIKENASISGAEVGCQGEVGTACAMACAAATRILGGTPPQIECAASMGMEHCLGLTCDPVCGLVQIPCIERNAIAAARAMDAAQYALMSDGSHIKETSEGGLANLIHNKR